jgi:chemotaxis protein histidine kinase CheA
MADETQNLAVTITAQDAGAAAVLSDVRAKIAAIEAELGGMSDAGKVAGESVAAGATAASSGLTKTAVAAEAADAAMKQLEGHAGTLARGLDAAGLAAGGAAARVEGFVGALAEMEEAAPALLLVAGGLTAIFAAFEFIKTGIEDATRFQQAMESLRITVESQGGDWAATSEEVNKFAEAMVYAAGVTSDQTVTSLNRLVEAGASVHDAQAELAVGAQMVAAGMGDWTAVTYALTQAQGGNMMQLGRLDPAIRQLVKDHADLSTIMQMIAKQTDDAIAKNNSLALMTARLHAEIASAGESIGRDLLPELTYLSLGLAVVVNAANAAGVGVEHFADGLIEAIGSADKAMIQFAKGMVDIASLNWKGAVGDFSAGGKEMAASYHAASASIAGLGEIYQAVTHGVSNWSAQMVSSMATVKKAAAGVGNLDNNPVAGNQPKGGGASGYEPANALIAPQNTQLATSAINEYDTALKAVDAATRALAETVDTSMTSDKEKALHFAQLAQAADQARAQMATLIPTIQAENAAIVTSTQSVQQKYAAYKASTTALNDLENKLKDHTKVTQAEKDALDAAKASQREAEQAWKESQTALSSLTSETAKHVTQLNADTKAIDDNRIAQDNASKIINDAKAKAEASLEDEEATYKKSISQQLAYWQQKLAIARAGGDAMADDAAADYAKIGEIESQFYKQSIDQYDAMIQHEEQEQQKFVADFIDGTGTLKDRLKKVWDDILGDFDKMIEQMIFKSNSATSGGSGGLFGGIFSAIFGGNGATSTAGADSQSGPFNASGAVSNAASQYGMAGMILGPSGASSAIAALPTNSGITGLYIGADSASTIGAAAASSEPGVYSPPGGWDSVNGIYSQSTNSPIAGLTNEISGLNKTLSGVLEGAALGSQAASITGGSQTGGAIGGALGGILGIALHANPLIGAGIDLAAGLIGSLFGPHFSLQDQPDVREPVVNGVNYGTFVADMTGHPGTFNGQVISPQAPYNVAGGGQSEMAALQAELAQALKDPNASASLKALTAQLQALEGTDTTNGLGIASEKNDMFTLNSGQQVNVEQYMALVSNFMSQAAAIVPSFSITRTYPNYNRALVHGGVPPETPPGTTPPGTTPPGSTPPPGTRPPPPGTGSHGPGQGNDGVYVDMRGAMIVGPGGLAEAANAISTAMQRASQGQIPGAYSNASSLSGVSPKKRYAG